jgi:hypothetical protein
MREFVLHWANSTRFLLCRPLAWLVLLVGCVLGVANNMQRVYVLWAHRPPGAAVPPLLDRITDAALLTSPLLWLVLLAAVLPSAQRTPAGGW